MTDEVTLSGSEDSEDSLNSEDSLESEDSDDATNSSDRANNQQFTKSTFIEIIHHPHSGILEPDYIFCDLPSGHPTVDNFDNNMKQSTSRPWAPFKSRADFEFTETVIQAAVHTNTIKRLIQGIRRSWTDPGHSQITFRNMKDFKRSLGAARKFIVQVSIPILLF